MYFRRKGFYLLFNIFWLFYVAISMGCSNYIVAPSGIYESKISSISRIYLPISGGQTIPVPKKMTDTRALWMPMYAKEQHFIASQRKSSERQKVMDIPMHLNAQWFEVDKETTNDYLFRLTQVQANVTARALARAEQFLPSILIILKKYNLPEELAALPFVESTFEPKAISSVGAVGLWQLMPLTAKRFGLIVTKEYDERFDPQKSTYAAVQYLKFLYEYFHNWPLAVAAYNCGEGAMQKALAKSHTSTLHSLIYYHRKKEDHKAILTEETLSFVPKFAAAIAAMSMKKMISEHKTFSKKTSVNSLGPNNPQQLHTSKKTKLASFIKKRIVPLQKVHSDNQTLYQMKRIEQ